MYLFALGLPVAFILFAIVNEVVKQRSVYGRHEEFAREMEAGGRLLDSERVANLLRRGEGTLLIEVAGTWGLPLSRCWWTPDDVLAAAPTALPDWGQDWPALEMVANFARECVVSYLHADSGSAGLIDWERTAEELREEFPQARIVTVVTHGDHDHETQPQVYAGTRSLS